MSRHEDIQKQEHQLRVDLSKAKNTEGIAKVFIKWLTPTELFSGKKTSALNVKDAAILAFFNNSDEEELGYVFAQLVKYKTEKMVKIGYKASLEMSTMLLTDNDSTYGLDLKEARKDFNTLNESVLYSTALLNKKTFDNIKLIDKFLNHEVFSNVIGAEEELTKAAIPAIKVNGKLNPNNESYYNNSLEALDAKPPKDVDIVLNENKKGVTVTRINPELITSLKNADILIAKKRENEQLVINEEKNHLLHTATLPYDGNGKFDSISSLSLARILSITKANQHKYDKLSLDNYCIKTEEDYKKRWDYIEKELTAINSNSNFRGFTSETDIRTMLSKTPSDILKSWEDYDKAINNSIDNAKNNDNEIIDFPAGSVSWELDDVRTHCQNQISKMENGKPIPYKNMVTAANYFALKLLTEPGAKRTIFGKGIDWNNEEKVSNRTNTLKPTPDGKYNQQEIQRYVKSVRDNLLSDKVFLEIMFSGKSLDKLYKQYKDHRKAVAEDITYMNKRFGSHNLTGDKTLSEESLMYLSKTKDELDTLYKGGGKYRSKYMKELYQALNNVIDSANESKAAGKGLVVKAHDLEILVTKGVTYFTERKGKILSGPTTDRGKARLQIVEELLDKVDDMINNPPKAENKVEKAPKAPSK